MAGPNRLTNGVTSSLSHSCTFIGLAPLLRSSQKQSWGNLNMFHAFLYIASI
uniref:Uncharacterized protein n=1 Tax=Anguilla anguilla TaxID=7936 RepID=A0A0E9ULC9_ANGAN